MRVCIVNNPSVDDCDAALCGAGRSQCAGLTRTQPCDSEHVRVCMQHCQQNRWCTTNECQSICTEVHRWHM